MSEHLRRGARQVSLRFTCRSQACLRSTPNICNHARLPRRSRRVFQVDIKEQRLAGLRAELAAAAEEVAAQRGRCKEGDQMLSREKGRSEVVRKELRAAKEQLAGTKSKLGAALKDAAEADVRATGAGVFRPSPLSLRHAPLAQGG